MADNYTQSSSFILVPNDKMELAREIIENVKKEFQEVDDIEFPEINIESGAIWLHNNEYFCPEGAEYLVRKLVEELELPGVHVVSWAYTCSKPRIDEFGGGAFAVKKGCDTVWIDAAAEAEKQASLLKE
jgi:hypothetical protein